MPQLSGGGGGGGGDPELCATDEMIPFKDEGDPQKEKIFAEISHPEEEGDLADIKSSLVNESEIIPASNGHEVSWPRPEPQEVWRVPKRRKGAVSHLIGAWGEVAGPSPRSARVLQGGRRVGLVGNLLQVDQFRASVAKRLVYGQEMLPITHNVSSGDFLIGPRGAMH
jgi:hypothetical protein